MLRKRIIPCLLLKDDFLVKTIKFKNPKYVGDPINAITIFNDKEVDEIILLDIASSKEKKQINYQILEKIVKECFVPLTYGGGITDLKQMKQIYELGIEKIVINNSLLKNTLEDLSGLKNNLSISQIWKILFFVIKSMKQSRQQEALSDSKTCKRIFTPIYPCYAMMTLTKRAFKLGHHEIYYLLSSIDS